MSETPRPKEPEHVSCEVCLKNIPNSVAQTLEGEDYIHHFCGLECYGKWQQEKSEEETQPEAGN